METENNALPKDTYLDFLKVYDSKVEDNFRLAEENKRLKKAVKRVWTQTIIVLSVLFVLIGVRNHFLNQEVLSNRPKVTTLYHEVYEQDYEDTDELDYLNLDELNYQEI